MKPPTRSIRRLLVANRGEIAIRVLQAARELCLDKSGVPIETFALYTEGDQTHCDVGRPDHRILLSSPGGYMDISYLVTLAITHSIDAIHPGYGFLSESAVFSQRMWEEAGAIVIGPGWEILEQVGDKLQAKALASRCNVPVLPTAEISAAGLDKAREFGHRVGYPIMIKAVDGGGGRGIRLVGAPEELSSAIERAKGESPSGTIFVEKAAVGGFHHVEVQIIGDGTGQIVEYAPAIGLSRSVVKNAIDAAVKMASATKYFSLGTFEFLVNDNTEEFYFLEINPRLQVEHTITECISGVDLVQTQLLLAQGLPLDAVGFGEMNDPELTPTPRSIQLRLCAEDPELNFSLSVGNVSQLFVPSGHGVRVDTHFSSMSPTLVGSEFDNLLAKIIITAGNWGAVVRKARRVLADTVVSGVKTNLNLLRGIMDHARIMKGSADTQWLEANLPDLLKFGHELSEKTAPVSGSNSTTLFSQGTLIAPSSSVLFRKGDAWSMTLEPLSQSDNQNASSSHHSIQSHLLLTKVLRNEFPSSFIAEIEYAISSSSPSSSLAIPYRLHLAETSASASALASSTSRRGDSSNPNHLLFPLSGKLIEVLVGEGDEVARDQVVAYVKQMKMELEIRSHRPGVVKWVIQMEDSSQSQGIDVAEGHLLLEFNEKEKLKVQQPATRGKL
ncbi:hypothetical protein PISL3812_08051 [Talaromyces islandicus]|uniref:Pyruvate carboxylase n=1 Tax=Talaromyces islandicus TaxID=28573 RepID=A0A0U1M5X4_TALIS|nr:hypothetical protein PISL3812_08051 [Talaromyces islandicus]